MNNNMALGIVRGMQVIPSEDIPNGYKRIEGNTIFVSPGNYALMKPLSAKAMLITLGLLTEIEPEIICADTSHALNFQELVRAFDAITRPTQVDDTPLPFDPDDYPVV